MVTVHEGGRRYTVEFVTLVGEPVAVVTPRADQVRPVRATESANAREVAAVP